MIYARNCDGTRETPLPGARSQCPGCGEVVLAKCGTINVWHWAHEKDSDCDHWSEPETEWHLRWKGYFTEREREVITGPHRADIKTKLGRVIELQHSPISQEDIIEREQFYGKGMVWVIDASDFIHNFNFRDKGDYYTFRWKWPRKIWSVAKRPIFLDPGEGLNEVGSLRDSLFHLKKMGEDAPVGGYGTWGCKWEFLRYFSSEATINKDFIDRICRVQWEAA